MLTTPQRLCMEKMFFYNAGLLTTNIKTKHKYDICEHTAKIKKRCSDVVDYWNISGIKSS